MHRPVLQPPIRRALACLLLVLPLVAEPARAAQWSDALRARVERIDRASPGSLGVYVKRLDNGETMSFGADRPWYLGSTAKVPIAIAVLRQVDAGKLSLASEQVLQDTDKVDGSGQLVWAAAGTRWRVDALLTRMLGVSDNTAANLLIRAIGEEQLNATARELLGREGFREITNFTRIRREVYAQLHPDAARLTSRQLVEIAAAPQGPRRVEAVRAALDVPAAQLKTRDIGQAYARYYASGVNTATLEGYGGMLEKLVRGELLSPASTRFLFTAMKFGRRGDYRLEGGIPKSVPLIHKTGTQYRRACHVAVLNPQDGGARGIVVATCAADLDDQKEAGGVFRQVGTAVAQTLLTPAAAQRAR